MQSGRRSGTVTSIFRSDHEPFVDSLWSERFVLVVCGARVSPGVDADPTMPAPRASAGAADWPRVVCHSGPTDEGGFINDPRDPPTCACWGAVAPSRPGLCLWEDYPRDRAADFVCAIPGAATIALIPTSTPTDAGPAPWVRGACIPAPICAELERTGQPGKRSRSGPACIQTRVAVVWRSSSCAGVLFGDTGGVVRSRVHSMRSRRRVLGRSETHLLGVRWKVN